MLIQAAAGAAAFAAIPAGRSAAQNYPQRPVKIIVPYAAGGASDIIARLIAQQLERDLGQPFIVDNRAGGASMVGTQAVANAAPNGDIIGVIDSAFVINPGLFGAKLPYDTVRDFAPVSLLVTSPLVLVVHPSVAANNVKELVALAAAQPGKINFASAGSAPRSILPASSSGRRPISILRTFRIGAARRPSPT
jgi:tripartite-type tricarboxylate transporter receptor subunit TctC